MSSAPLYLCPMHSDVRESTAGRCPHCSMRLIKEGTPFGLLRHMFSGPLHIAAMVAVMLAVMAAVMMMRWH